MAVSMVILNLFELSEVKGNLFQKLAKLSNFQEEGNFFLFLSFSENQKKKKSMSRCRQGAAGGERQWGAAGCTHAAGGSIGSRRSSALAAGGRAPRTHAHGARGAAAGLNQHSPTKRLVY